MCGTSPNFDDWRQLSSINVWEVAALIHGFDPRAGADVVVQDPDNPKSQNGISPDLSWEIRMLVSAVEAGDLITAPIGVLAPNDKTGIQKTSLVSWLRSRGDSDLADLANELDSPSYAHVQTQPQAVAQVAQALPDPVRRLTALRDLGGTAKWITMKWRFTKIKELVEQEKRTGKNRSDEKTIRKDLTEAAEAESVAKRNGLAP